MLVKNNILIKLGPFHIRRKEMHIIIVYDINTEDLEGQKRLNKIYKLLKRYLNPIQKSVFEGDLTKAQIEKLKFLINKIIDKDLDSVIFFKTRDKKFITKETIGIEKNHLDIFI